VSGELKGILKLLILKELKERELSGYDLMRIIGEKLKKPSPGSIYPVLKDLREKGFLNVRSEGRKKVYTLSEKGRNVLEEMVERERNVILKKVEALKDLGIFDEREAENFYSFILKKRETLIKLHRLRNWPEFVEALSKAIEISKDDVEILLKEFTEKLKNISDSDIV